MITLRKAGQRGHFDFGWLDTNHTFSFGEYHDPSHMGFRSLRVINEDRVAAGKGFGTHGHRDMEILTYVLEGALEHKDSTGTQGIIKPGDAQRMSAGSGIMHSEKNASDEEPVHFLQIWIMPSERGIAPGYEQKHFPAGDRLNKPRVIASPDGREGSVRLRQDAVIHSTVLDPGTAGGSAEVTFALSPGRGAWIQVARGSVEVGHGFAEAGAGTWTALAQSDGAALSGEERITLRASGKAEVLLFDLA
ncbi:MAG: Pirin domain protein [Fibrobacteres bacterium]|nr:Pirin domain protein [Fibrobacterota bacterium]